MASHPNTTMARLAALKTIRPGLLLSLVAGGLLLGLIVWGLTQVGHGKPQGPSEAELKAKQEQEAKARAVEVEGGTIEQRDPSGKLLWTIRAAGKLTVDEQGRAAVGDKVRWEMQRANQQTLLLEAPKFRGDYDANRLVFTDGVTVSTDGGKTNFTAPQMTFEIDTHKLVAEGGATVSRAPYQCTAQRAVFDDNLSQIRLSQGIEARDDTRGVVLNASEMTIQLQDEMLTGTGGIRFRKGPYTGSAGRLWVDNRAQRLRLSGGVRLGFTQ